MKVILFFGHHKVGSTALQGFLSANFNTLLKHGILYPSVEAEGLIHNLSNALNSSKARSTGVMNLREPHNALAFRMLAGKNNKTPPWHGHLPALPQMIRALRLQANVLQPHTMILCSEVMSNFATRGTELVERLKSVFPEAEYELYCVLRRPDDYLVSWHSQRLRFGQRVDSLSNGAAEGYFDKIHFDYRKMLDPWLNIFNGSQIHLRDYGQVLLSGGTEKDFMNTVDVRFPRGLKVLPKINVSMPRAAMEIMRQGNILLEAPVRERLLQFLLDPKNGLSPMPNREIEMYGETARSELCDAFEGIHRFLSDYTRQERFFPDWGDARALRPIPESDAMAHLQEQIRSSHVLDKELRDFVSTLTTQVIAQ